MTTNICMAVGHKWQATTMATTFMRYRCARCGALSEHIGVDSLPNPRGGRDGR